MTRALLPNEVGSTAGLVSSLLRDCRRAWRVVSGECCRHTGIGAPYARRGIVPAMFSRALPLTDARPPSPFLGRGVGSPRGNGRALALDGNVAPIVDAAKRAPAIIPGVPVGQPVVDDPGRVGPYAVATGRDGRDDAAVGLRPRSEGVGDVVYPVDAPGARPLVLILHGRHATRYRGKDETGGWPCRLGSGPSPARTATGIWQGSWHRRAMSSCRPPWWWR